MMWDLPISVDIDGNSYPIRNKCDYRVVLDVIKAVNDDELELSEKIQCALFIFYEDLTGCIDLETAVKEMFKIINGGEDTEDNKEEGNKKPRLMDWEHDFKFIAPAVSKILGYEIRTPNKYTHWWTLLGAYMEIGECTWSTVVGIRKKLIYGKKLDKSEEEFYKENKKDIDLPHKLTAEEQEWLNSDW